MGYAVKINNEYLLNILTWCNLSCFLLNLEVTFTIILQGVHLPLRTEPLVIKVVSYYTVRFGEKNGTLFLNKFLKESRNKIVWKL
jgi:hypothetical protein